MFIFLSMGISYGNDRNNLSEKSKIIGYLKKIHLRLEVETEQDSIYFYLVKAKKLATKINADSLLAEVNNSFAFWYREDQGKLEEAKKYLQKNILYATKIRDSFLLMRTYISLGGNFIEPPNNKTNNLDSLIFYTKKGLRIAELQQNTLHILIAKSNLANFYLNSPTQIDKALPLLQETIELTEQDPEGFWFRSLSYQHLGFYYFQKENYTEAINYLKISIELAKKNNSSGFLLTAYKDLYPVYEKTGNFEAALDIYKKAHLLTENIHSEKIKEKVKQLEIEFEAERKENQIIQLQLLNTQQEEHSRRQRALLITIILGGALISFFAFLAFLNNNKRQDINAQLIVSQKEMATFKTHFYTNITHEFRTPLTVIQGMAELLTDNAEHKEMIIRNSQNLLELVNQMLDLQKLEVGALEIAYEQGDIIAFIRYISESFRALAKTKSIHLGIYDETKELLMDFDPNRTQQIISNLLSNAIKFTPSGGEIILHAKKLSPKEFQIIVKDNGIGISKVNLPTIFDRFHQITQEDRTQLPTGTGVGLALVKELTKLINGNISVESDLGKGTSFTLVMPIHNHAILNKKTSYPLVKKLTAPLIPQKEPSPLLENKNTPLVLLIEDNLDVIKYLQLSLQNKYQLISASNGKEGIEKAWQHIPDLIISDVMMPIMDGFELCKILKTDERSSHIPIILLTAKASKANQLEGLEQGADAYLVKPFNPLELHIRIEKLLEVRKKLQAYYMQWNPFNVSKIEPSKETNFLLKVNSIIENHFEEENFSVVQLSHALNLSRMQVHRKLKAICNKSASQFIKELRLQKAQYLLKTTDQTISEIAYAVGFSDPNYFSKVFTNKYGHSPSVTRK